MKPIVLRIAVKKGKSTRELYNLLLILERSTIYTSAEQETKL